MHALVNQLTRLVLMGGLAILALVALGGCASVCNRPGWDCKQVQPAEVLPVIVNSYTYEAPTGPARLYCVRQTVPLPTAPTCWSLGVYEELP
jgi:hypothetical protein